MTRRVVKMTLPVAFRNQAERPVGVLCRIDGGGINQQDRNVVLNGIHTAASTAFQALPIFFQDQRFLAKRADEDVEQILGNHGATIVALIPYG